MHLLEFKEQSEFLRLFIHKKIMLLSPNWFRDDHNKSVKIYSTGRGQTFDPPNPDRRLCVNLWNCSDWKRELKASACMQIWIIRVQLQNECLKKSPTWSHLFVILITHFLSNSFDYESSTEQRQQCKIIHCRADLSIMSFLYKYV